MHRTHLSFLFIALLAFANPVFSPAQAQARVSYRLQIEASTTLSGPPVRAAAPLPAADSRRARSHAPVVGAVVGAVALPLAGHLVFHDHDSGSPNTGGVILVSAVGALLGYMVGLAIRGHY